MFVSHVPSGERDATGWHIRAFEVVEPSTAEAVQSELFPIVASQENTMSRHPLPASLPGIAVVVGWDNPMSTFFAQVTRVQDGADDRDPVVFWIGGVLARSAAPRIWCHRWHPTPS